MVLHNKMSISIFAPIIVLCFYSFGSFRFFNLFGLAQLLQIILVLFCILGFIAIIEMNIIKRYKLFSSLIFLFFSYYGFMLTIIRSDIIYGIIQALVMTICALYLLGVSDKKLEFITKSIIIFTAIFSLLGGLAFVLYVQYPSLINQESFKLSNSTIGNEKIIAASILDYFTFLSGDGFELFGHQVMRVKGFSNEPSSTIVHYLAPAGLAFFYDQKYRLLGIIISLFSLICISSLIGIIAILGSFLLFFILSVKNKNVKKIIIIVSVGSLMFVMMFTDFIVLNLMNVGSDIYNYASYDLLARKEGSAIGRLDSYSTAIYQLLKYPFGGSSYNTMTGLWLQTGLVGGIFLICLLFIYSLKLLRIALLVSENTSLYKKYAVCFLLSIYIITFTISAYGWDRIPGVIMLILFYRIMQAEHRKIMVIRSLIRNTRISF